jgi:DNA-binding beta-propeller fold protein YncE
MLTGPRAGQDEQPRWEHCLIVVNRDGKLLEAWTQHDKLFTRPHKVKINPYDPQKHVWLVEDGSHQIFKFTNDGKLVQSWGESRVPGNDERHFNRPTDIAWLPDGTFFVSDGYTNTRVLKFDKDGKFLMTWGTRGTGPGQFNTPHSIAVGRDRRVYVADRSNHRIQIFDENGKYLDEWPNMPLAYTIHMTDDNHLWVGDGWMHKILKYDLNGQLLDYWGTFGNFPGGIWGPHQMSVDQEGNLYIAQVYNSRPSKFRPRPGANPARIMGREIGFGKS